MKGERSEADAVETDSKLKSKGAKAGKRTAKPEAAEDPNKPKRPSSAFFVFMEEFRQQFKEANPNNKSVAAVGKAAGEKWKEMTDDDKTPYFAKAEKRKSDYNKNMRVYNKPLAKGWLDFYEVNDEDDEEGSGEEVDDD